MGGAQLFAVGGGAPRKPTRAKELAGTARKDRSNAAEPRLDPVEIPPPPPGLTSKERESWEAFRAVISPMRIVTLADRRAFERLVEIDALIREASERVREDRDGRGRPVLLETNVTKNGEWTRVRPELELIAKFEKILLYYFRLFGLTPADRSRVSALADAPGKDPLDEFGVSPPGVR